MSDDHGEQARIAALEARVTALSATLKSVLTTLMLRGLLTRAEIDPLLAQAQAAMTAGGDGRAATAELDSIKGELPGYLREAMGPAPDPDEHDH